jgi:hypothetical protein
MGERKKRAHRQPMHWVRLERKIAILSPDDMD